MRIAFLGTGLMGTPMVRNLLEAGYDVSVWNRTLEKAEVLGRDGATVFAEPDEAVVSAEIVITMLSDGMAVSDLLFTKNVAAAMRPGTIVIDMGSIRASEARDHAERLEAMRLVPLDAPVSGGTKGAETASLAIMVGGKRGCFDKAEPVLKAMGRPVYVGPSGAGQLAKLANQAIVATTIGVVAEAMLLAQKGGADPAAIREALKGGFADSIILQQHGARMSEGDFVPGGKCVSQLKDIDNALEEAQSHGLTLPLTEMMRKRFHYLIEEMDGAELDHSALYLELLERNGLS